MIVDSHHWLMWAWWHKLCERYFANCKKCVLSINTILHFFKIQERKKNKICLSEGRDNCSLVVSGNCENISFSKVDLKSTNLMIRLDFVSGTGYIFQHCGLRGESSFWVLTIIVIMRPSPVWFDVRPTCLVTTAHDHLHGRHHHCHSCTGDTCRSYLGGN